MQSSTHTALLGMPLGQLSGFSRTRLSRSMVGFFHTVSTNHLLCHIEVPQPRGNKFPRFRLFRFRSPLLTESLRFLFLRLLRCFTSAGIAFLDYTFIQE